jgi:hypothetical protein
LLAEEVRVLTRTSEAFTAFGDDGLSGVLATAKSLSQRPGVSMVRILVKPAGLSKQRALRGSLAESCGGASN